MPKISLGRQKGCATIYATYNSVIMLFIVALILKVLTALLDQNYSI